jgi:tRNA(Arg) A34 adenosine deaminase TadA
MTTLCSGVGNPVDLGQDRPARVVGDTQMENHEPFLREAIALSKSAMEQGDEPFGSVLVKDGEVILRAENSVFTGHDMTNHA